MAAKKSDPDAKKSGIPSLEKAMRQGSVNTQSPNPVKKIGDLVNSAPKGGKKGSSHNITVNGKKDIKTEIAIPSKGEQDKFHKKQESANAKMSKKKKGMD
jgi:hypothetical protein